MTLAALIKENMQDKESWHYTSLLPYAGLELSVPAEVSNLNLPDPMTTHRIVFIDGVCAPALSSIDDLQNGFTFTSSEDGAHSVIDVSEQSCLVVDPVEVLFLNTKSEQENEVTSQLDIVLGKNSRLTLIERHMGMGDKLQARHHKMNIDLAAQSKLVHGKVVNGHDKSLHIAQTKINVAAGAFYDHFGLIVGGKIARCAKEVILDGELAEARLVAGMTLRGKSHGDITSSIQHKKPHGSSYQVCKTVLTEKATGAFQGKVLVDQDAQKTDAYQLCRSLLLSNQAEMNAKPELEIYADDVKCAHGTAVGDLDEDALFYLLSRGIDRKTARRMLVEAFIGGLIDDIQSPEMASLMKQEVTQWLLT